MAKSQKDLKGWKYILEEPQDSASVPSTPTRRTRGNAPSLSKISLQRTSDDLKLEVADVILFENKTTTEIGIIKDIQLGVSNFLDMTVALMVKITDVEFNDLPRVPEYESKDRLIVNEVFVTSCVTNVLVKNIIDKVNVVSEQEFAKDVAIDESNSLTTFMCRRGCDEYEENFSDRINFRAFHDTFRKDPKKALEYIYAESLPKKEDLEELEDSENVSDNESEDNQIDSDDEDNLSDNEDNLSDTGSEPAPEKKGSPRKTYVKRKPEGMLSPFKKKIKTKQSLTENLPNLSPKKSDVGSFMDSSSEEFKAVKAKLHTSSRLNDLPCRIEEFTKLYMNLEHAITDNLGCCLYVSGTPGVGKTATIRAVIELLKESMDRQELPSFDYLEINGLKLINPNTVYEILWEKISGFKVSTSNAALLLDEYFKDDSPEPRKPIVLLLDELDQLVSAKQNIMYNFFEWPRLAQSNLIVIAVANTMDLPERMLINKLSSRLGLRRFSFAGYTFQQLGEIIAARLAQFTRESKKNVVLHPDAIGFASRKVAGVSGDARRALMICRRAVEIAEHEYSGKEDEICTVLISHISRAINETTNSPTAQYISSLPFAAKVMLVGVLLRMKRSGLARNSLGDIIDEVKNCILLLTDNKVLNQTGEKTTFHDLLYNNGFIGDRKEINIRPYKFSHIITELVENGILMQQNVRSERHRAVNLNVSQEEVISVLKSDKEVSAML